MRPEPSRSKPSLPSHVADRRLWQIQPVRDLVGIAFIACAIWLIFDLRRFFAPVLIALALAYLVEPMVEAGQRRFGLSRWVLAIVLTILLTFGIGLLVTWVGPLLAKQVKTLSAHVPNYLSTVENATTCRLET